MKYNTSAGFTLIEVLVVIVILGLLLILGVPAILSTRNSALAGISAEEENSIKEAGKILGIDLDDYTSEVYNCKTGSWILSKCTKKNEKWVEVTVTLDDLKEHDYFSDKAGHCKGNITVTKKADGKDYSVSLNDVKCND